MTRAEELRALAERVEAGEHGITFVAQIYDAIPAETGVMSALEGSIDACAALHKAVLGERWTWSLTQLGTKFEAGVSMGTGRFLISEDVERFGSADTPARAWLAAILRALAEDEGRDG